MHVGERPVGRTSSLRLDLLAFLLVAALWLALIALAHPAGDFPLNDDWAYGGAVKRLVEEGRLQLSGWTSMPLVAHVAWGSLWCKLRGGFSFETLRASTLVLAVCGLGFAFAVCRLAGVGRALSAFAALCLGLNPIYFSLPCTFMTDVTFCSWMLLSTALFLLADRRRSRRLLLAASLAAAVATLTRQLGLALPLAYAIVNWRRSPTLRDRLWTLVPFAVVASTFGVFELWLRRVHGVPEMYTSKTDELFDLITSDPIRVLARFPLRAMGVLVYLGLFTAPFGIGALLGMSRRRRAALLFVAAVILAVMFAGHRLMPLFGNVWFDFALGPLTLRDAWYAPGTVWPRAPAGVWWALSAVGAVSGLAIADRAIRVLLRALRGGGGGGGGGGGTSSFAVVLGLLYTIPFVVHNCFDRYVIALIPLCALWMSSTEEDAPSPLEPTATARVPPFFAWPGRLLFLALFAWVSVVGTHDMFEWNRARWSLLGELEAAGIAADRIDGGFEYNGSRLYRENFTPPPEKSWWWVVDDEYVVAFGPFPGYDVIAKRPFQRWIDGSTGEVVVLHRR